MILRHKFSASAMSNNTAFCIVATVMFTCSIDLVQAAEKTQNFISEWTVAPWTYHDDTAAMDWRYIEYEPWDTSLGELREVRVQTEILGEQESRVEDVRIRQSFFKGWSPADYQLSTHSYISFGDKQFFASMSFVHDSPEELQQWLNSDTAPPAHYYFESRTAKAGHSISAGGSNALLRNLDQVMAHIDQDRMQQACDGIDTFSNATEELAGNGGIEFAASELLVAEADQIWADLCRI